ncbi:SDR family oxidoreductase [Aestuariispira insulae]|uniref:3-oxoacyl-[acyl-carrier protein] reductase n=1 Tax=Aestuariispira insulae TaxID=1461337 RepID=A0A3D9HWM1_9PROT|nr:SDR family oxidoreductase [Aestuariispira insulae]RED53903.1 3-oxoacyl-[acyl-carrier protein] reductase [Aestuariispira insulae]
MDMGIAGKWAIVCASSKGLGKACARALAEEGVNLVINGRTREPLAQTAKEIVEATGVEVKAVACDVTTEEGRAELLAACSAPDILVNNAGGPPPGNFRDWDQEDWHKAVDANMLAPIFLIKAVVDGMIDRGFGRIVNITSAAVKSPIPILGLSNGARAGLTGFVAGLSRETAAHNVTINNLLPGPFETDRLASNIQAAADKKGVDFETEKATRMQNNPCRRFGNPEEFGAACAFLCSRQSGYMTGQNILLDGGGFNSTL